jgi:presenilin-like A22 family membrane protease
MKREMTVFALVLFSALVLSFFAARRPDIADYRPEIISSQPGALDILNIIGIVIVGTGVLLAIRLLGLKLRFLVDGSVLIGVYYLVSIFLGFWPGLIGGILAVLIRASPFLIFLNATTFLAVESFALLFGLFLKWDLVLLLLAGMSAYDVLAVFYTKHMKFLWFGSRGKMSALPNLNGLGARIEKPYWRNTLAFFFTGKNISVIGAGDFALPAMLVVSVLNSGGFLPALIVAVGATAGFLLLEFVAGESSKTEVTGIPGIPTITIGAALGLLISLASGLLA